MKWVEKENYLEKIRVLAGYQESYTESDRAAVGLVRTHYKGQPLQGASELIKSFQCAV